MDTVTAAIVGLGRIASLLEEDVLREKPCTHAGAIAANPACLLVAGCDTDEERRRLFSQRWQVPVYSDAAEMIGRHTPDILVIATHPDSHYRYCRLAAERGIKAVVCEKPLAGTLKEARLIAGLAERMTIITNHERRYSADYIKAKALLDAGTLGPLLSVQATLFMGRTRRLVDVLWHDGTHLADAIMFLSGMTLKHRRRIGAKFSSRAGTAWLSGELIGSTPVPVIISLGAGRDHIVFEMEFSCESGRLRIGNGVFEVWKSEPSPYAEGFRSLRLTESSFDGPTGYFATMLDDAVACIREPARKPISSAVCGLRVIEYLRSITAWY